MLLLFDCGVPLLEGGTGRRERSAALAARSRSCSPRPSTARDCAARSERRTPAAQRCPTHHFLHFLLQSAELRLRGRWLLSRLELRPRGSIRPAAHAVGAGGPPVGHARPAAGTVACAAAARRPEVKRRWLSRQRRARSAGDAHKHQHEQGHNHAHWQHFRQPHREPRASRLLQHPQRRGGERPLSTACA